MALLNRLFGAPEEINGGHRCPTYLYRWHMFSCRWFKAYLHHFVGNDWSKDLHDHPRRFVTIGIWGSYYEYTPFEPADSEWAALGPVKTRFRAPWIRSFPAEHTHRLEVGPSGHCWTIALVFKITRQWGFWHDKRWIYWRDYVMGSESHIADKMKGCD